MTVHIILPISARKVLYELLKIFLIYHLEMKTSTQQDIYTAFPASGLLQDTSLHLC